MSSLKKMYLEELAPVMKEKKFKNINAVPKIEKVIVNVGIGKIRANQKLVDSVINNITLITGQKPVIRKSKKAISGFKVRQGDEVGLMVTLRSDKMYDFLQKLANATLPRLRDFRGLDTKSFDGNANFSMGIREHIVFPEVSHQAENIHGLEIVIVTSTKNKEDAQALLEGLGFPFNSPLNKKESKEQNNG